MCADVVRMLTDLDAKEVSVVNRGANRKKKFPIWKAEITEMYETKELLAAVLETEAENEEQLDQWIEKQEMSEKAGNAMKAALRLLSAHKDESAVMKALGSFETITKQKPEEEEEKKTKAKAKKKDEDEYPPPKKSVSKSELSPEIEAIFKSQEDRIAKSEEKNQALGKVIKELQDSGRKKDFIQKAHDELGYIPGQSDEELGELLMSAHDVSDKFGQQLEGVLKGLNETVKASSLLTTSGSARRSSSGGAWQKLEALADGMVQKSTDSAEPISKAKALDVVMKSEEGQRLYQEYLSENPAQRARTYQ